jgi:hypothetical protein
VLPIIKKAVLGFELPLVKMFEDHRGFLTKASFLEEFGGQRCKLVPEYVDTKALLACFHFIDEA